jgi:non-canonical purine NTP pyrophosphatase (RdgB/HAM1 family)
MSHKKDIYFVTGNEGKFTWVDDYVQNHDAPFVLHQLDKDIPEYQSLDAFYIAQHKAKAAYNHIQKPVIVDDGGIYLTQYHNFPGPLSKFVYQGVGLDGFWKLAEQDSRAYFMSYMVYMCDPDTIVTFKGEMHGHIIKPDLEQVHPKLPFADIFIPEGYDKPLNQLRKDVHIVSHREKALQSFMRWFKDHA